MYKALIADLDGTAVRLTSDGSDIDNRTRHAVAEAIRRGFKIACATGRDWSFASPVITSLGLTAPCVIAGGTRIVDAKTGEKLWEKSFEKGVSEQVLEIYQSCSDTGFLMASFHDQRQHIKEVTNVPDEASYMYLVAIPEAVALEIVKRVNGLGTTVAHLTPSWDGEHLFDLHTTHKDGTKANGIREWHKLTGISQAETIGMGDSGNDLPIFDAAGLKVAVANAQILLKDQADYIAPAATDHALEHVIERFLLDQR
ncbi:MAG TPA: HAD family hydrolase [Candidatus Saccharimonadia bacterium]|jgi:hypothetical protein|nr:HAD family hydrolase [Candidatus Saccharimonadia bacterium]